MRLYFRALAATALVAAAIGCEHVTDPPLPAGAVAFLAPSTYSLWWGEIETCSGKSGDLSAVTFYRVPDVGSFSLDGSEVSGYWSSHSNEIVFADLAASDAQVVRHEMLHALVRHSGHPIEYFRDRCGGFVSCNGSCATEAGVPSDVPVDALVVNATDLVVSLETMPTSPSTTQFGGLMTFVVSAKNARTVPVWVNTSSPAYSSIVPSFGYRMVNSLLSQSRFAPAQRIGFAAGETKRLAFDEFAKIPGLYTVRGWFNAESTTTTVTIRP